MGAAEKALVDVMLAQGPLGVVVLGLGYWVWRLQAQLSAIQERRVQDAFRISDIANACAVALERNTDTLRAFLKD